MYQSGQEIGLVQERLVCVFQGCLVSEKPHSAHGKGLPRLSREQDGAFCSRSGLPRLSRERDGAFCSRSGLPRLSLERDGAFCSREGSSEVVS